MDETLPDSIQQSKLHVDSIWWDKLAWKSAGLSLLCPTKDFEHPTECKIWDSIRSVEFGKLVAMALHLSFTPSQKASRDFLPFLHKKTMFLFSLVLFHDLRQSKRPTRTSWALWSYTKVSIFFLLLSNLATTLWPQWHWGHLNQSMSSIYL